MDTELSHDLDDQAGDVDEKNTQDYRLFGAPLYEVYSDIKKGD